jgi:hypothetical protein
MARQAGLSVVSLRALVLPEASNCSTSVCASVLSWTWYRVFGIVPPLLEWSLYQEIISSQSSVSEYEQAIAIPASSKVW